MLGEYLKVKGEGTGRDFVSEERNDAIIKEMKEAGEIAIKGLSNILVEEERAWMRAKVVVILGELYSKEDDGIVEILFNQLSQDKSVLVRSIIARYILPEIKKDVSGARVKEIDSVIKKADLDPWPADKNRAFKILDVGCEYGEVSHGIAGYYRDKGFIDVVVVGVDLAFVTLIEAEKNRTDDDIVFVYGNIDRDRFGPVDVVLSKNLYPLDPEDTKGHAESLIRQLEDKDGNIHGDGAEIYFTPSAFSAGTDGSTIWASMSGALKFSARIKSEGLDSRWHVEDSFKNPFGLKGIENVFGSPWPNSYGWVTATLSPNIMIESDKVLVKLRTDRFPDGELYLRILNPDMVKGEDISVNCAIDSPDDLVRIVLLMDMLRYYEAKTIQLVLDGSPHIINDLDQILLHFCDGISLRYHEERVVGTKTRKLDIKPLRPIKDKKSTVWIDPVLYQHRRLREDALDAAIAVNAESWRIALDKKDDNPLNWTVSLEGEVKDKNVALVHSMENSTDIAELWIMLMALKRAGASSVSLINTYEGYTRQDKVLNKGEGISAVTMLNILDTLVDNHMALNVHYADKSGMVQMGGYKLYNLNAFTQIAEGLFDITKEWLIEPSGAREEKTIRDILRKEFKNHPIFLLGPDDGAFGYVQEAAEVLKIYIKDRYGLEIDVYSGYMDKERVSGTKVRIPGQILDEKGKAINEINGISVNECWVYI
ncbi:MAG: ribose-phosphate pyrophosphokinase-like domain-containing protein, partial [Candidatus Omnitrophota bacterium]